MKRLGLYILSGLLAFGAFAACVRDGKSAPAKRAKAAPKVVTTPVTPPAGKGLMKATFAAGCFWCIQPPFDKTEGVVRTTVGYTGGVKKNPTYKEVAYGRTRHVESIEVVYDPKKVSYARLLQIFWKNIDPTAVNRMFVDVGPHYRGVIYVHNKEQQKLAEESKKKLAASKCFRGAIATEITKASPFYAAETYHQKFYKKSPYRYKSYRYGSGRDQFIKKYWTACKALDFLR